MYLFIKSTVRDLFICCKFWRFLCTFYRQINNDNDDDDDDINTIEYLSTAYFEYISLKTTLSMCWSATVCVYCRACPEP